MATRLVRTVAEFQVNVDAGAANGGGVVGSQTDHEAVALSNGRFVIAYQSYRNGTADQEAAFNLVGTLDYGNVYNATLFQGQAIVAPRLDGSFGVVFTNERHGDGTVDTDPNNITYRLFNA